VEASHRLLEQSLKRSVSIRIDLSRLEDIDTAGVQLLLAYCREAGRLGVDARFVGETPALADALRLLGLNGALARHTRP
jgi:anti-anti-sigma regulatory factor